MLHRSCNRRHRCPKLGSIWYLQGRSGHGLAWHWHGPGVAPFLHLNPRTGPPARHGRRGVFIGHENHSQNRCGTSGAMCGLEELTDWGRDAVQQLTEEKRKRPCWHHCCYDGLLLATGSLGGEVESDEPSVSGPPDAQSLLPSDRGCANIVRTVVILNGRKSRSGVSYGTAPEQPNSRHKHCSGARIWSRASLQSRSGSRDCYHNHG